MELIPNQLGLRAVYVSSLYPFEIRKIKLPCNIRLQGVDPMALVIEEANVKD
jgi:hypothetical protein